MEEFESLDGGHHMNPKEVDSFFKTRRSCRRFTEEPLSQEQIEDLLDSARFAPTPTNSQNIRFVVLRSAADIQKLVQLTADYYLKLEQKIENPILRGIISATAGKKTVQAYRFHMPAIANRFRDILAGRGTLFHGATCVVVVCAPGTPETALAGCNLAAMEILLAAQSREIGACYNGYVLSLLARDQKARKYLGIRKGYHAGAVIGMGRPDGDFYRVPPRRKRRVIWFGE